MKKNRIRIISLILCSIFLFSCTINIFAKDVTEKTAYSIGGTKNGDFTENISLARYTYFVMGAKSYSHTSPTYDFLSGNGVGSSKVLNSEILFFNSHANYNIMELSPSVNLITGVNSPSSNSVGLSSYDMSNVELVSFVGCSTCVTGTPNLVVIAVNRGAETAVGFKSSITSRFGNGPKWLQVYNDSLANGYTVVGAINRANTAYPCDLATQVNYLGNGNLRITNRIVNYDIESNTDDININYLSNEELFEGMSFLEMNLDDNSLSSQQELFAPFIKIISSTNENFNLEEYKIIINHYGENNGMIQFERYFNNIKTSDSYMFFVENGKVTSWSQHLGLETSKNYTLQSLPMNLSESHHNSIEEKRISESCMKEDSEYELYKSEYFFDTELQELQYREYYLITYSNNTQDVEMVTTVIQ